MISNTGPVRFTLDPHWLQQAGDGQKKLRLVDSQFNEIPFAVVLASDSIEVPEWVSLQVSSFDYGEGEQTMILENNHPETPVASIRFQTHSRDFHRAAEVWTSNDKENWHWQTSGYIVDASSQINFRQLEIALQPVRARWIRIRLTDTGSNRRAHASLTIQTLQEVIVQLPTEAALSIRQIQAKLLLEKPVSKSFGSLRLFPAASTEDSNTILPLNDLRLPIDRISFEVDQSVFHVISSYRK
ncbi:MAG: discoidin domain-containing protein [Verrucomicrobia bacterium]|nr:discoidin domain-containing protein [Verrucomicrobiota bacterium]